MKRFKRPVFSQIARRRTIQSITSTTKLGKSQLEEELKEYPEHVVASPTLEEAYGYNLEVVPMEVETAFKMENLWTPKKFRKLEWHEVYQEMQAEVNTTAFGLAMVATCFSGSPVFLLHAMGARLGLGCVEIELGPENPTFYIEPFPSVLQAFLPSD